jgi:AraC-like DNA-binding protein
VLPALRVTLPALLDLDGVEAAQRARMWTACALQVFPGLSLDHLPRRPTCGTIKHQTLGPGSLSYIQSPPVRLHYVPPELVEGQVGAAFSISVQLSGEVTASQHGRECRVGPGEICALDEQFAFRSESSGPYEMILVRMPRSVVLAHHPHLMRCTAAVLNARDAGTVLLRETVLNVLQAASNLSQQQHAAAIAGIIQMMGIADFGAVSDCGVASDWRIRSALTFVELSLFDPGLTASAVAAAQGISRRRLDTLFRAAIDVPITAHILNRRLALTASFLRNPRRADQTVAQIAQAAGFADPAHFTRTFKRHFGCSPGRWRLQQASAVAVS